MSVECLQQYVYLRVFIARFRQSQPVSRHRAEVSVVMLRRVESGSDFSDEESMRNNYLCHQRIFLRLLQNAVLLPLEIVSSPVDALLFTFRVELLALLIGAGVCINELNAL